jgi:hypothetical protein
VLSSSSKRGWVCRYEGGSGEVRGGEDANGDEHEKQTAEVFGLLPAFEVRF